MAHAGCESRPHVVNSPKLKERSREGIASLRRSSAPVRCGSQLSVVTRPQKVGEPMGAPCGLIRSGEPSYARWRPVRRRRRDAKSSTSECANQVQWCQRVVSLVVWKEGGISIRRKKSENMFLSRMSSY